mmetsp:Transcript_32687/g.52386  ORF Transcript_32687/g.52386 Transcript_32687/m.52386 type:complete len:218 (+) Transcript_32687:1439-2092(+)
MTISPGAQNSGNGLGTTHEPVQRIADPSSTLPEAPPPCPWFSLSLWSNTARMLEGGPRSRLWAACNITRASRSKSNSSGTCAWYSRRMDAESNPSSRPSASTNSAARRIADRSARSSRSTSGFGTLTATTRPAPPTSSLVGSNVARCTCAMVPTATGSGSNDSKTSSKWSMSSSNSTVFLIASNGTGGRSPNKRLISRQYGAGRMSPFDASTWPSLR